VLNCWIHCPRIEIVASPFLDVICCMTAIDDDLVFVLLIAKGKGTIYFPPVIIYSSHATNYIEKRRCHNFYPGTVYPTV
jgi:hypothetical protein